MTNKAGCDSTITLDLTIKGVVGLISSEISEFKIYPNPTDGLLYFDMDLSDYHMVKVFDLTGKLIKQVQVNDNQHLINLPEDNGIYIVELLGNSKTIRKRVLKQ